ncbi:hypothetical protein AAKU55_000953 [Oxalobacteraceae bacterium GrIS 1.11]
MSTCSHSTFLLAACALLTCHFPLRAHAKPVAPAPAPDWRNSGNVTLLSDYLFRAISQTQGKPTAQATVGGAYLGLFGSGVPHAPYNHGSGSEIDLCGRYQVLDSRLQVTVARKF